MRRFVVVLLLAGCCDRLPSQGCDRVLRCTSEHGAWVKADERSFECLETEDCGTPNEPETCETVNACGEAEADAAAFCLNRAERPAHEGEVVCPPFSLGQSGCEDVFACCDHGGDGPTCWTETYDGVVYLLGDEYQLVCDVCDFDESVTAYLCP